MAKASKPAPAPKPSPKYRDAESGHYVSEGYANKHPKTTVRETDKARKR